MALVPVFIVFFYHGQSESLSYGPGGARDYYFLAFVVFLIASATDAVDGYIARKRNLITNFGKLMDPLADKVLTTAAFIVFVDVHAIPAWMVIVILAREFIITGLRGVAASEGVVIAAGLSGKLKTVFQMVAICLILLGAALGGEINEFGFGNLSGFGAFVAGAAFICLWAAVIFTVYSGIEYLWKGRKMLNLK